ncbi:MAG: hypothetical protein KME20_06245 [Kaiparowitsia implicata GSE-PSE-MK54-09C]|nr:hypothetical protein [Kaiparowitsia implicata GSE-PSE-MK54-09C]
MPTTTTANRPHTRGGAPPIEIFSVGPQIASDGRRLSLTESDLKSLVASFNKSGARAPFVPGHPKDDQPQLGYATKLGFRNGKLLVTEHADLDPTFKSIVKSGELRGISVKLRLPSHHDNKTGTYELRHIGFLGRSLPAVPDLAEPEFSGNNWADIEFIASPADPDPEPTEPPMSTKTPPTDVEFSQRLADLEAREAEFAQRELEFTRVQAVEPLLDNLIAKGSVLPAEKAGLTALFSKLDDSELEFSQGDETVKKPPAEILKALLTALPPRVTYGEVAKGDDAEFNTKDPKQIAARIDTYRNEQRAKGILVSYADALSALGL